MAAATNSRKIFVNLAVRDLKTGGAHAMDPQDHGFMYGWSFYGVDGHHWGGLLDGSQGDRQP